MKFRDTRSRSRFALFILFFSIAAIPVFIWGLLFGSVPLTLREAAGAFVFFFDESAAAYENTALAINAETAAALIFGIRLPRLFLALAVGASLGTAGAVFQGLFRNPLADPYIIGASSGAALGAAIAVSAGGLSGFGFFSALGVPGLSAFAGSFAAVFLVFTVSRLSRNAASPGALILAGTSVSAFASALLALVLAMNDRNLVQVYYWLLGSLSGSTWSRLVSVLPPMLIGGTVVFFSARPLDILLQGDEAAKSLGLNPPRTRFILALAATLPVAASVSVSGVIGFIGLIAPHTARFFAGPSHKRLLPASALTGAVFALAADNLARTLIPPVELPLGVITSLCGAPFFLFLLVRGNRAGGRL